MTRPTTFAALALALASSTNAQYGGWGSHGGGNFNNGGSGSRGGNGGFSPFNSNFDFDKATKVLTAHAVLASLAFVILFPLGGMMIRLLSFPGLWLFHGLFQIFAYLAFTAAFGMGVWMAHHFRLFNDPHAIIGVLLFALLFFQPIFGLLHHVLFKKHRRRQTSSYLHIWLGRFCITLGMINGGLGLRLAKRTGSYGAPTAPSNGQVIAYGVVAGVMWTLYMLSAIIGERRRSRALAEQPTTAPKPAYNSASSSTNSAPVKYV